MAIFYLITEGFNLVLSEFFIPTKGNIQHLVHFCQSVSHSSKSSFIFLVFFTPRYNEVFNKFIWIKTLSVNSHVLFTMFSYKFVILQKHQPHDFIQIETYVIFRSSKTHKLMKNRKIPYLTNVLIQRLPLYCWNREQKSDHTMLFCLKTAPGIAQTQSHGR